MSWFRRKKKTAAEVAVAAVEEAKPKRAISIARAKVDIYAGHKLTPGGRPSDAARVIRKDHELLADDPIVVALPHNFEIVGWVDDHGLRTYIDGWAPANGAPLIHED